MFGLGKAKSLVGLDIGSSAVKAVELRKKGNTYELVNLGIEPVGQDTVVDGAIMDALSVSSAIEKIFNDNRIKTRNVATSYRATRSLSSASPWPPTPRMSFTMPFPTRRSSTYLLTWRT